MLVISPGLNFDCPQSRINHKTVDMWQGVEAKVAHLFLDETEWRSSGPMVASMGVEAADSWNQILVIGRGGDRRSEWCLCNSVCK